tara:strand:- start:488 stop:1252 length:765 start_codon:yes stop_codon:yes gene_type:complete
LPYLNSDLYESNIPIFKVWVRKEFTKGLKDYHGEALSAIVCGVRTEPDKCLAFHIVFTGYESDDDDGIPNVHGGAMWAKMPIVALMADIPVDDWPPRMETRLVQPWDCSSYYHSITRYSRLTPSPWICYIDGEFIKGRYYFTVDYAQSTVSEDPAQHKQNHVIALLEGKYRGNIVALPNNRCRVHSPAYWITGTGAPDFAPNNHSYCAEQDDSYTDWETTFDNLYNRNKRNDDSKKKRHRKNASVSADKKTSSD